MLKKLLNSYRLVAADAREAIADQYRQIVDPDADEIAADLQVATNRLAAAGVFCEVALANGRIEPEERERLKDLLLIRFGLSDDEAEATARLFRALGDPARVRIVNLLATSDEPVCVCELVEPLGLTQPTVSHHLKKLTEAGLLAREQRGVWAYYSLDEDALATLGGLVDTKGGRP